MDLFDRAIDLVTGASPHDVAWVFIWLAVWQPVVTLVHELGHAVFALADTDEPVTLVVGTGDGWRPRLGRLTLDLSLPAVGGVCVGRAGTWGGMVLGALAGPLSSLAFAGLLYVMALGYPSLAMPFGVGAGFSAFIGLSNLLPWRHSWLGESDGLLAIELVVHRREILAELGN